MNIKYLLGNSQFIQDSIYANNRSTDHHFIIDSSSLKITRLREAKREQTLISERTKIFESVNYCPFENNITVQLMMNKY